MNLEIDWLTIILRWLHIVAACAALGGTLFIRLALLPSLSVLPADQRTALHQAIRGRWAKVVMGAITLLLVSGLWNYVLNIQLFKQTEAGKMPAAYHIPFGVKFLLALVVFFIASALVGRSAAFEKIRQNAKFWLTLNLVLLLVIATISNVLRGTHVYPKDYKPTADKPQLTRPVE